MKFLKSMLVFSFLILIETIVFAIMSEFQGAEYYSAENNESSYYKSKSFDTVSEIVDLYE